ncbi:LuxR C-terminal-related transcriptional regulator [Glaesserella parasuis]|uniref:LuxR C-terminal-related transcriptional regulator n=1 Tax=Glaesserella parasuis TaxID=738 RepID=UPI003853E4BE
MCELLILGFEPKEIGEKLNLSFKTVHVHRSNAINKLNVKNNVELANLLNSQLK